VLILFDRDAITIASIKLLVCQSNELCRTHADPVRRKQELASVHMHRELRSPRLM